MPAKKSKSRPLAWKQIAGLSPRVRLDTLLVMSTPQAKSAAAGNKQKLKVKYEQTTAQYANQFLVNTTNEEVFLDLSSGAVTDPSSGEAIIPIHSRIAMSYAGARRLSQILAQAVQRKEQAKPTNPPSDKTKTTARLPKVDN